MIKDKMAGYIKEALGEVGVEADGVFVEKSSGVENGDYASNVALVYGKKLGKNPKELAGQIAQLIDEKKYEDLDKVESAGPGFINFYLSTKAIKESLEGLDKKPTFLAGKKINVEFISANPTGELHIGHGRGAFYGDVLCNILELSGANVTREFYINDSKESAQINELGKTALGVGEQYKTPQLDRKLEGMDFSGLSEAEAGFALAEVVQKYNQDFITNKLGIKIDVWYSEDERLRESGLAEKELQMLKEKDFIYEKDGALWAKTSEHGDDEDRVVVRSDGSKTYFVSDIAYHSEKFNRGYDTVIDILGADHQGHIKKMMATHDMLGWKGELQVFATQLVTLKKDGETKKLSKRAGNVVLIEEMVDEIGVDAMRWFFLEKSLNTHMEFNVELAKERSAKNPVYYVQYAHARISSILKNLDGKNKDNSSLADVMIGESGKNLALKLIQFPEIVGEISKNYQVHNLLTYVYELAGEFSGFYRDVHVINEDIYNAGAVELISLTKNTISKSLSLLGISAPEHM